MFVCSRLALCVSMRSREKNGERESSLRNLTLLYGAERGARCFSFYCFFLFVFQLFPFRAFISILVITRIFMQKTGESVCERRCVYVLNCFDVASNLLK